MIVVAGGTGLLGRDLVARLTGRGLQVRVLTRDLASGGRALGPLADQVELVEGDVRDPSTLGAALAGADLVVGAVQGFGGRAAGGLKAVDLDGNRHLIAAAAAAGVDRFVLLSIHNAKVSDPLALARAKAAAEVALAATRMRPTLVRPTAYMETWAAIVGEPILASGSARVFGRGRNPINFVAAADVAAVVDEVVVDADGSAVGRTIEVVGPADLAFDDIVALFAAALGRPVAASHVPPVVLQAMAMALRPFKPVLAEQVAAAVVLDTTDRTAQVHGRDPQTIRLGRTTFDDVIRRMVAAAPAANGLRAARWACSPDDGAEPVAEEN